MLAATITYIMVSSPHWMCRPPFKSFFFFLNCSSSSEDESAGEREEESTVETSEVPESNAQAGECQQNAHHVVRTVALSFPLSFLNLYNGGVITVKAHWFIQPSFHRNHIFPLDEVSWLDIPTFFGRTSQPPFSCSSLENVSTFPLYLFIWTVHKDWPE